MIAMIEFMKDLNTIEIISCIPIIVGTFLFWGASIGVIRFPDFYTRMHAAGKADTLSSMLVLTGLSLYNLDDFSWYAVLVSIKIISIAGFVLITSPTSTHALMQSGYEAGIRPWMSEKDKEN